MLQVVLSEGSRLGAVMFPITPTFTHRVSNVSCCVTSEVELDKGGTIPAGWVAVSHLESLMVIFRMSSAMPWQVAESLYSESQAWWSTILIVNISRKWRPWAIMEDYHDWPLFPLLPTQKPPQTHRDVEILRPCVEIMPKYVADGLNFVKFLIFRTTIEIGFPPACARTFFHGLILASFCHVLVMARLHVIRVEIMKGWRALIYPQFKWDQLRTDWTCILNQTRGYLLSKWYDAGAKLFANGSVTFIWKQRSHWMKGMGYHQVAVVIQAPNDDKVSSEVFNQWCKTKKQANKQQSAPHVSDFIEYLPSMVCSAPIMLIKFIFPCSIEHLLAVV